MDAEERPVVEVGADYVARPFEQQSGRGTHRRGEQQPEVAAREEPQRDLALYVLEEADLVQGAVAGVDVHGHRERAAVRRVDLSAKQKRAVLPPGNVPTQCAHTKSVCTLPLLVDFLRLADVLRRYRGPLLCQIHHSASVHQPVTELVAHCNRNKHRYH